MEKKTSIRKYVVLFIVTVFAICFISSSLVITKKNEYKVIKKFGKIEKIISKEGISFKTPFIENEISIPKELLIYDIPESDVITKDKKSMVVDSYVTWKITDPKKFAKTLNSNITAAEGRINTTVFNAIKNTISSMDQNDVFNGRDTELSSKIMLNFTNSNDYGFVITDVKVKKFDLPSENKEAVYQRMISERAEIAAKYNAEGDSESQKQKNETDRTVSINISNAQTSAEEIIAEGEKEYMQILNEAYNDPDKREFYNFQLELNSLKKYMVGEKTLVLPKDSPLAKLFINGY